MIEIPSTPRRKRITACRVHRGPYVRRLHLGPKLNAWAGALRRRVPVRVDAMV
ncbi:hypothetical protein [Kitasatospora purpeofusca]|uniref:Uncharacterized protein n=1 Tax=Kitasatospora purpeofusca TaxID=67352 RepID=A0ABZ1U7Q4_9ACTN|nr:hypothetical protein [Kitasatospora purpeofusca]